MKERKIREEEKKTDGMVRRKAEVRMNQLAPLRTPYIRIVGIWQIWREREREKERKGHEKSKDRPLSTGENKMIIIREGRKDSKRDHTLIDIDCGRPGGMEIQ